MPMIVRLLSVAVLAVPLALPAGAASELPGPEGVPWWKSLAACGGAMLRERDYAIEANRPEIERATLTNEMNEYLSSAIQRLRADLGIEESAAKKSVYRWAGKTWQEMIDTKMPVAEVEARIAKCNALLAEAPKP